MCNLCNLSEVLYAVQARKDVVKEHCRRINSKIEKIFTIQCFFVLPDPKLKADVFRQIGEEVLKPYTQFWRAYESMQLLKTPAKHFRCGSQVPTASFGGASLHWREQHWQSRAKNP